MLLAEVMPSGSVVFRHQLTNDDYEALKAQTISSVKEGKPFLRDWVHQPSEYSRTDKEALPGLVSNAGYELVHKGKKFSVYRKGNQLLGLASAQGGHIPLARTPARESFDHDLARLVDDAETLSRFNWVFNNFTESSIPTLTLFIAAEGLLYGVGQAVNIHDASVALKAGYIAGMAAITATAVKMNHTQRMQNGVSNLFNLPLRDDVQDRVKKYSTGKHALENILAMSGQSLEQRDGKTYALVKA